MVAARISKDSLGLAFLKAFLLMNGSDFLPLLQSQPCYPHPMHTINMERKSLTWPLQQMLSLWLYEAREHTPEMVNCYTNASRDRILLLLRGEGKPACRQRLVRSSLVPYDLQLQSSAAN